MRKEKKLSRLKRRSGLGAIGAAIALIASVFVPTAAHAAPPQAGTYIGTSDAYTGATFSFDIDANGVMSNFDSMSYCTDGMFTNPVYWAGGPSAPIEAGQPFDLEWQLSDDGFGTYYELQGTVNADGTASGTGRAGSLPSGTCGGMGFAWSASVGGNGDDPSPQSPEVILEKTGYYDHEIQNVGIMIRGENFPVDTDVEITIHQVNNGAERYRTTVRSDANGEVYDRYVGWLEHQTLNGNHRLTLTADVDGQEISEEVNFRANPGGEGPFQYFDARDMTATPQTISQSELATEGLRIESDNMDGREDTAQLLINGKLVGEVPVVEIADQFGAVDYEHFDDSFTLGEHEVALRTVHVSGVNNPRTWERVAWDTFTVTEDPEPVEVTATAPTRDGNTITIPVVEGVTYTDGAGDVLSADVTLEEDQTLTVTATADDGYVLTDGTHEWTFTYEAEVIPDPEPVEVTATAPTRDGNTITIPVVEGVTYTDGSGAVLSGGVTLVEDETLTIVATADDGYVLTDGTHEWTFTYEAEVIPDPEPVEVTATAPTRDGNTITIPVVEGVTYTDGAGDVLSADVTLEEDQTLTVTATADDGYVLTDGTHEWTFTYGAEDTTDPEPGTIPGSTPSEDDLDPNLEGVISAPDEVQQGEAITIVIEGATEGDKVGLWLFSDPVYLGMQTVNAAGTVTVIIPADTEAGEHRIAAWAAGSETLVGWDYLTVVSADSSNGSDNADGTDGDDQPTDELSDSGLAETGAPNTGLIAGLGLLLLVAGTALVVVRRRSMMA